MKILIGADIVPTKSNQDYFTNGEVGKLIDPKLKATLEEADYRIFNLEVPLTDVRSPLFPYRFTLYAPVSTVAGLKALGIDFVTIANNHILDQNTQGLYSTIEALNENDISFAGAGSTLKDASKAFSFKKNGITVGIYCCAEHEFSIATNDTAGANPFDPLDSLDQIDELKEKVDYCIVLYHGGKEHYRYPSPNLQKACRKMVNKGADLVVCQHSHCIGCEEKYNEGTIVYGQGNFLFDNSESKYWQTAMLIEVNLCDEIFINYLPIVKAGASVRMASLSETDEIMSDFYDRNRRITENNFVEKQYIMFAAQSIEDYLYFISGRNIIIRIINRLSGYRFQHYYLKKKYNEKKRIALMNVIECEAHRELFIRGLSVFSYSPTNNESHE